MSAVHSIAIKARFVAVGAEPEPITPAGLGKLIVGAAEKWAKAIKFAGIKPRLTPRRRNARGSNTAPVRDTSKLAMMARVTRRFAS